MFDAFIHPTDGGLNAVMAEIRFHELGGNFLKIILIIFHNKIL